VGEVRLTLEAGLGIRWGVALEEAEARSGSLGIGEGPVQVWLDVRGAEEAGSSLALSNLDVPSVARLWHLVNATSSDITVHFVPANPAESPITATLSRKALSALLEQSETSAGLGPRTRTLSPPVYLRAFWGYPPHGREYGQLDWKLARLRHFSIVPRELANKARRADAPNNWAIVCTPNLPQRREVLEALEPLLQHRQGQVLELADGRRADVVDRFVSDLSKLSIDARPYHLLVLGDLDVISMEVQYFLQSFAAAGRLALKSPEDYGQYAEKVVRFDPASNDNAPPHLAFIASTLDDVNRTNVRELVDPLASAEDLPCATLILRQGRATKRRVLEVLRRLPEHSTVFISAHGFEQSRVGDHSLDDVLADQRAFQGALVLDDFPSERTLGSAEGLLSAQDTVDGPVAPGGVLLLHACYSGGTMIRDTMPEWINLPRDHLPPGRPFISALAQALLANPLGPVALYAHVNRSHQYHYFHPGASADRESFTYTQYHAMLKLLAGGDTIGLGRGSARSLTIQYMDQALTLSRQIESFLGHPLDNNAGGLSLADFEQAFVQYSFATCNFRNYLILGDPMSRVAPAPLVV
jgi:hypothetical protein